MSTLAEQIAWLDKAAGQNRKMVKACLDHNEVPSMWQAELNVLEGIISSLRSLEAQSDEVRRSNDALRALMRAYVSLLESARERIIAHGGECDSVEVMERGDPYLAKARAALGSQP